jgi:hypothetical protein
LAARAFQSTFCKTGRYQGVRKENRQEQLFSAPLYQASGSEQEKKSVKFHRFSLLVRDLIDP